MCEMRIKGKKWGGGGFKTFLSLFVHNNIMNEYAMHKRLMTLNRAIILFYVENSLKLVRTCILFIFSDHNALMFIKITLTRSKSNGFIKKNTILFIRNNFSIFKFLFTLIFTCKYVLCKYFMFLEIVYQTQDWTPIFLIANVLRCFTVIALYIYIFV